jgi:hypothetical protein
VVKAVDENGKPTEWEAADLPSGGGGAEWKLVADVTLSEDVESATINTDTEGNTIASLGYSELFIQYKLIGLGSGNYTDRFSSLSVWFSDSYAGGYNADFSGVGNGYSAAEGTIHAIYPKDNGAYVVRFGHAQHSEGKISKFKTYGTLASANFRTTAGLKAGSRIVVYGR